MVRLAGKPHAAPVPERRFDSGQVHFADSGPPSARPSLRGKRVNQHQSVLSRAGNYGPYLNQAENRTVNAEVAGSIPAGPA
jgi:hypothetical protein